MKKLMMAVVGIALCGQAMGVNWIELGKTEHSPVTHYIDVDSINKIRPNVLGHRPDERYYSIFIKAVYPKNNENRKKYGWHYTITNFYIACSNHSYLINGIVAYGAKNNVIERDHLQQSMFEASDFKPAFPSTMAGEMVYNVCDLDL